MNFSSSIYPFYKSISRLVSDCIFSFEQDVDSTEAYKRIEQEAIYSDGIDRKALWGGFSRESISSIHPCLKKVVAQFEKEGSIEKTALDLGCGKAASTLYLLKNGWKVIAVDYSQEALDNLQEVANRINPDWIQKGQLTLACQDIEKYVFPKNVALVVASMSLPYLNPLTIRTIWDKIHDSLTQGGRVIGHFFPRQVMSTFEIGHRAMMGPWFTDISTVQSLLNHKNYQIEACEYSDFWFIPTRNIEFVGKKQNHFTNKRGFISVHLSSYFDAVRGLPSKKVFPHFYPFCADRLSELRELSKLTILGSGTTAFFQSLFDLDPTVASYTFVGSISAWFIFKQFAEVTGEKAWDHIQKVRNIEYKNSEELNAAMQKIQQIQRHKKVQKLFNPPPPDDSLNQVKNFLAQMGIDPKNVKIKLVPKS